MCGREEYAKKEKRGLYTTQRDWTKSEKDEKNQFSHEII